MKLLILGENATHRRMLSRTLASVGYGDVLEASAEPEARPHLQGGTEEGAGVDLVLVLWDSASAAHVPLAPWVREIPGWARVPVMVIDERAAQHEASDYFFSSSGLQRLRGTIEAYARGGGDSLPHSVCVEVAPAASAILLPAAPAKRGARAEPKPRILVVEDHEPTRVLIGIMLREEFEPVLTADLQHAAHEAHHGRFAAAIIDIILERDSGVDVLELLLSLPAHQYIPKIACTAVAMPGDRERLLGLGFDRYVSKPFRKLELVDALREALGAASPLGTGVGA